jgi:hypothetical protein
MYADGTTQYSNSRRRILWSVDAGYMRGRTHTERTPRGNTTETSERQGLTTIKDQGMRAA